MGSLDTYQLIVIFASTIIISYFFNSFSKKSGIPSVLLLIGLGVGIGFKFPFDDRLELILKLLGTVGLILIVLEAALDLKLLKEKLGLIIKSLFVSIIGLAATSYISALFLINVIPDFELVNALLLTIPLSVLSSAIILPSIEELEVGKKEFMIYESTFSDIIGIVSFYGVLSLLNTSGQENEVYGFILKNLFGTILFSVIISYVLIYLFQKLKGHAKLFLLISVLLVLYALGKMFHLSSLIIILVFGLILNNYTLFFRGFLKNFIENDKIENIIKDFKVVTLESAFVIRTFFFILFGWSVLITDLFDISAFGFALGILLIIYMVRIFVLLLFNGTISLDKVIPESFLAPRGLITILLFYAIPNGVLPEGVNFNGILIYVILISCLLMSWSLVKEKKRLSIKEQEYFEFFDLEKNEEIPLENKDTILKNLDSSVKEDNDETE